MATRYGLEVLVIESREGGGIFSANRPWGPPSLLFNGYRVIPGVNRPVRGVEHPTLSRAEVKERVDLYVYSPFVPS